MFKKIFTISFLFAVIGIYFNDEFKRTLSSLYRILASKNDDSKQLFTAEELKKYDGVDKPLLYLSLLGNVFDVTKGEKHYGPNQPYNFFIGKDGSRNFITGKFSIKDLSDDVTDLTDQNLRSLKNWLNFYKNDYKEVGKLIGRYYDEYGQLTAYGKQVQRLIKNAEHARESEDLEKLKFPPCNVEWDAERGTRVWCTNRSGGIARSWIGKPRQLYEPGSQTYRCACISDENERLGTIKEYDGCDKNSDSCFIIT